METVRPGEITYTEEERNIMDNKENEQLNYELMWLKQVVQGLRYKLKKMQRIQQPADFIKYKMQLRLYRNLCSAVKKVKAEKKTAARNASRTSNRNLLLKTVDEFLRFRID